MYRDEIFLKLNKHTGFNKHTGVVDFAQNRKNQMILEKFRKFWKKSEIFGEKMTKKEKLCKANYHIG